MWSWVSSKRYVSSTGLPGKLPSTRMTTQTSSSTSVDRTMDVYSIVALVRALQSVTALRPR